MYLVSNNLALLSNGILDSYKNSYYYYAKTYIILVCIIDSIIIINLGYGII